MTGSATLRRGWALGLALAGALLLLVPAPAQAHATLLGSDPEDGAVVTSLPGEVTLRFNEPVQVEGDGVTVLAPGGDELDVEARSSDNEVIAGLSGDGQQGTYVVAWKITSADGHTVQGAVSFAVGAAGATPSATPGPPERTLVVPVLVAGVLGGLGLLALAVGVVTGRGAGSRRPAWWVTGVAALVLVPLVELRGAGRPLGDLTDAGAWFGGLFSWPGLLLGGVALGAGLAVASPRRTALAGLVAAAALAAGVVVALPGPVDSPAAAEPSSPVAAADAPGLRVVAELGATTVGEQPLRLTLEDGAGAPLTPYDVPQVTVSGEVELGAVEVTGADGEWTGTVAFPRGGEWELVVSVRTTEFDNPVVRLPFSITPAPG
ncbi:copper resistance CopC family protein [Nocardioides sp. SYSU D00038]|uniref:copper resistance CopC family protein n=1 Tax=Nocardioides sp. SYSU D00038 TaxID=2812554 RepID=UPI00196895DA|nr:copper resistance CopC family protein [Nocardioides sp. SYSU D00038]